MSHTGLWKVEYCSRSHGSMSMTLALVTLLDRADDMALVTLLLGIDWVGEEGGPGHEPGGRARNLHGT